MRGEKLCIEIVMVMVMVLAIVWLSVPITPSSAQSFFDGNATNLPPCWRNYNDCLVDNFNSTDPRFNASSPSFDMKELICCPLLQQAAKNDRTCFCILYTDLKQEPSLGPNVTLLLTICEVANSLVALDTLCQGTEQTRSAVSVPAALGPPDASDSTSSPTPGGSSKVIVAIAVPSAVVLVVVVALIFLFWRKNYSQTTVSVTINEPPPNPNSEAQDDIVTIESLHYEWETLKAATEDFSDELKIGEGGFGAVYKGTLPNGQEIAVKRLSKGSTQGDKEFKNEVAVLAKLQHKNLVKLVGFCLAKPERLLVYEFMPNKSLDYLLFVPEMQTLLDWPSRYKIIKGVARGMLYLHEDSPDRIIHRDLKAANVLLDAEMNPRIADFGMAKIFDYEQTHCNTTRVVGTQGYMAPEYMVHGQFNIKSDVYSFGVLVLEILRGKRISAMTYQSGFAENLLSYAWNCWKDGRSTEFMDPTLRDSYSKDEIKKSIHLGLLCVQEEMQRRPTFATIVLMLSSNFSVGALPMPQPPAFMNIGNREQTSMVDTSSVPWSTHSTSSNVPNPR